MGIISWIVLGAIAGFLANMVVGGREGVIGTIILGIIGAWWAATSPKRCSTRATSPGSTSRAS